MKFSKLDTLIVGSHGYVVVKFDRALSLHAYSEILLIMR